MDIPISCGKPQTFRDNIILNQKSTLELLGLDPGDTQDSYSSMLESHHEDEAETQPTKVRSLCCNAFVKVM